MDGSSGCDGLMSSTTTKVVPLLLPSDQNLAIHISPPPQSSSNSIYLLVSKMAEISLSHSTIWLDKNLYWKLNLNNWLTRKCSMPFVLPIFWIIASSFNFFKILKNSLSCALWSSNDWCPEHHWLLAYHSKPQGSWQSKGRVLLPPQFPHIYHLRWFLHSLL